MEQTHCSELCKPCFCFWLGCMCGIKSQSRMDTNLKIRLLYASFNVVSFEVCNIWISTNLHFISHLWSSWLLDFCCHLGRVWVGGKNVQQLQSITIIELPFSHTQTSATKWSGEQDSVQFKSLQLRKNIWMCANVSTNIPKGCWL